MSDDPRNPALLIGVPTHTEARLLVESLEERGIRAWYSDEPSVFYKILPPFEVAVLVARGQIDQARAALKAAEAGLAEAKLGAREEEIGRALEILSAVLPAEGWKP